MSAKLVGAILRVGGGDPPARALALSLLVVTLVVSPSCTSARDDRDREPPRGCVGDGLASGNPSMGAPRSKKERKATALHARSPLYGPTAAGRGAHRARSSHFVQCANESGPGSAGAGSRWPARFFFDGARSAFARGAGGEAANTSDGFFRSYAIGVQFGVHRVWELFRTRICSHFFFNARK